MKESKDKSKKVKVIKLVQEGNAYGYEICTVDESALKTESKSVPEVFYIFREQIVGAVSDFFGV